MKSFQLTSTVAVIVLSVACAKAQDTNAAPATPPSTQSSPDQAPPAGGRHMHPDFLSKLDSLTDDQKAKIKNIRDTVTDKKEAFQQIMDVLTDDQKAQLKKMRDDWRAAHPHPGASTGAPGSTPSNTGSAPGGAPNTPPSGAPSTPPAPAGQ